MCRHIAWCLGCPPPPKPDRLEIVPGKLRFFRTSVALRRWLEKHHATESELWIGFYRKDSGRGGLTWSEAVQEALCYGWIDGIRKKIDDVSFTNRFTPRKPRSNWSNINIEHVARLTRSGRMAPAGVAAFALRDASRSGVYSFERDKVEFPAEMLSRLASNRMAKTFFDSQPSHYRRTATWWVVSAKRPETRERRFDQLMDRCAKGLWLPQFLPLAKDSQRG